MKERVGALVFCRELSVGARQKKQATKYIPEPYTESEKQVGCTVCAR